jgi:hypothetical protein
MKEIFQITVTVTVIRNLNGKSERVCQKCYQECPLSPKIIVFISLWLSRKCMVGELDS